MEVFFGTYQNRRSDHSRKGFDGFSTNLGMNSTIAGIVRNDNGFDGQSFSSFSLENDLPAPRLRSSSFDSCRSRGGPRTFSPFVRPTEVYSNVSTEFINHVNSYVPNKNMERLKTRNGFYTTSFQSWKRLHTSRAQLKAVSNISALLAGFAMVAMVEINLQEKLPDFLYIAFATCTTVLVVMHTLALMISTCILPHVDTIAGLKRIDLVEESPHEILKSYIQFAWILSTVSGIVLFMIEVVILCWMQFFNFSQNAAYASTAIVLPSLAVFGYMATKFYKNLNKHMELNSQKDLDSLEDIAAQLKGSSVDASGRKENRHVVVDIPE